MFIPRRSKDLVQFCAGLINQCTPDLEERIQRGSLYRNMYLTGDENGNPVVYPKMFEYIESLAAMYFSPMGLKYMVKFHGGGNPTQQVMGRQAAAEMHELMGAGGVFNCIKEAVKWSLVKGKAFVKLNWEDGRFAPYMVQPEFMGVLRPDLCDLHRQPAFVHTTYYTPSEFHNTFRHLPNLGEIMKEVAKRGMRGRPDERPDRANALKQIILGGLNPFQQAGNSPAMASSRGIVNWLGGPQATWDPKIMATLVRLDELWVKDSETNDWATFQLVGDVMITGKEVIRNAFADAFDPDNRMRRLPDEFREQNPLSEMHPFVPVCATELDGYFWGRSEICNTGVIQMSINTRMDGINRLLRRQENPPKLMTGSMGLNQQKYSALDKPGGFFSDPSPTSKLNDVYPQLPEGMWESLHELERMFDEMSGRPPVMKGHGESGVRAQGHAAQLTSNASPRFKNSALAFEDAVAEVGALGLNMLRVMDNRTIVAWLPANTQNVVAQMAPDDPTLEPPVKGYKQFPFKFYHLPENSKVEVDSHSSSPIFLMEEHELVFNLVKIGAMSPTDAVERLNPSGAEEIIIGIEAREQQKAELIQQHPELLAHEGKKKH